MCSNMTNEGANADLAQAYRDAGFGNRLGFGERPALLIIDFVRAYLDRDSPLYAGVEAALEAAIILLDASRRARIPVVHTRVEYQPGGADGGVFFRKIKALTCFERGLHPELTGFAHGLEPLAAETIVTKQYASAFFGTSLASTLTSGGIDTLLIAGLSTSGCVRATALDACQHGFVPIVVREAVGDRDARVHEANLFDLAAKYADVVGIGEVLAYLDRWRATPDPAAATPCR